jgi:hypothetical protein
MKMPWASWDGPCIHELLPSVDRPGGLLIRGGKKKISEQWVESRAEKNNMFSILLGSDGGLVQARIFSFLDIVRSDISFPILLFLISHKSAADCCMRMP